MRYTFVFKGCVCYVAVLITAVHALLSKALSFAKTCRQVTRKTGPYYHTVRCCTVLLVQVDRTTVWIYNN